MNTEELLIACQCKSEVISFISFPEDGDVYVSLYSHYYTNNNLNLKQRLKYVWHVLKTGKAHTDQIVLSKENTKTIADWINNNIKE
jgi:hypothetical protein